MRTPRTDPQPGAQERPVDHAPAEARAGTTAAWEMIEEGRYRPIRTRGSFPGRELG